MGVPSEHEAPASEGSAAEGGCSPWHARHGSSAGQARPHLPLGGPTEELEPATYLTGLSAAHRDSTMACQSRACPEAVSQTEPRPSGSGFSDRAAPVSKRFLRPSRARQEAVSQTEPRPSGSGFSAEPECELRSKDSRAGLRNRSLTVAAQIPLRGSDGAIPLAAGDTRRRRRHPSPSATPVTTGDTLRLLRRPLTAPPAAPRTDRRRSR
ncbi:MAG: hypothetical protein CHACPFDD_02484 [Phycisphaerae bacterium]|nr:hypothetical protein [Phycisphaerae bacterium]